jgi:hypothetical protein
MQRLTHCLITVMTFLLASITQAQELEWAFHVGSVEGDLIEGIARDELGNNYVLGYFSDPMDFDPSAGVATLTPNGTSIDIFVAKYDNAGNYIWAFQITGANNVRGHTIKVGSSGDVYVAGTFQGTTDFDPSASTANIIGPGSDDVFIAKYDANGNYIWAGLLGGTGLDRTFSIALDSIDNVYVAGHFEGTADFDPSAGSSNLVSNGGKDIFFAKYSSAGIYQWAHSIGGVNDDYGKAIELDAAGNVYMTGYFDGTVDFDVSVGTQNATSEGGEDIFLARFDNLGNVQWVNSMGGTGDDYGHALDLDSANNIYLTGQFEDSVDFDPSASNALSISNGNQDLFIAKYDNQGNWIWSEGIGGSDYDLGEAVHVDLNGDVYFVGVYQVTADFYPGPGEINLTALGSYEGFIGKYTADGSYVWARSLGGTSLDMVKDIVSDSLGNIFTAGLMNSTVDFDLNAGAYDLTTNGTGDAFLAKYSTCGTFYNQQDSTAICQGASHTFHDGGIGTTDSTHVSIFSSVTGCDSLIRTSLDVIPPVLFSQVVNICNGDSFLTQGSFQNSSGIYSDTLFAVATCDSIVTTTLTVEPPLFSNTTAQICAGDSVVLAGLFQLTAGLYTDTFTGGNGCDSLRFTTLTVLSPINSNASQAICSGDSIFLANAYQTTAGTYTDTFASTQGCDSLVHSALNINPHVSASTTASICEGNTIMLGGTLQNSAGTYMDTLVSSLGCDSVITTVLTVLQVDSSSSTSQTICPTDSVLIDGVYENTSGVYYDVFTAGNGCDSVVEFTLTVTPIDLTVSAAGDTLFAVNGYDSYQWIDCDNNMIVPGAIGTSFVPDSSGSYAVEISFMGCVIRSSCMTVNLVGISSLKTAPLARVFPNPTSDLLHIIPLGPNKIMSIQLFDVTGKLVHSDAGDQRVIDLTKLPAGLYLLQVELIDGNHAEHILKF